MVGALAALALPLQSRADPPSDVAASFASGAQQIGLLVGSGIGFPVSGENHDVDHTKTFGVFARWAVGLTDPLARGEFYEGNVEVDVEPMVLLNFHPRSGWAAGGSLLLHYNFLGEGAIVPFIEGGAGASNLAFHLDDQSDGFTFPLQASVGLHALAFARGALTLSVGYFHLSNAGRAYPNLGINAIMIRIGVMAFPSVCRTASHAASLRAAAAPMYDCQRGVALRLDWLGESARSATRSTSEQQPHDARCF